jgi:hypothetical protein
MKTNRNTKHDKKTINTEGTLLEFEGLIDIYLKAIEKIEDHIDDLQKIMNRIRNGEKINTEFSPHLIFKTAGKHIPVILTNNKKKLRIGYCKYCNAPFTQVRPNRTKTFCSQSCRISNYRADIKEDIKNNKTPRTYNEWAQGK